MAFSPRERLLRFLRRSDFATLKEAQAFGVSKMTLSHLVREGVLLRPAKRIYTTKTDWLTDPLRRYAPACTLYKDAVVCGVSALTYHDLTDEEEKRVWLAFPQSHRVVNQEYRLIYPRGASYTLGVIRHAVGKREVRIYNAEKSVVDAFKYLPIDVAHKALRAYLRRKDKNLDMLTKYARQLRKPLDDILAVLLSDE
jgi:predicted transcriptional regulator of viral defense system